MAAGAKINATLRMHTACTLYAFTPRAPSNRVRSSFFLQKDFMDGFYLNQTQNGSSEIQKLRKKKDERYIGYVTL